MNESITSTASITRPSVCVIDTSNVCELYLFIKARITINSAMPESTAEVKNSNGIIGVCQSARPVTNPSSTPVYPWTEIAIGTPSNPQNLARRSWHSMTACGSGLGARSRLIR